MRTQDMVSTAVALADVAYERMRQDAKWGIQNLPNCTGPLTTPLHPVTPDKANELRDVFQRKVDKNAAAGQESFPAVLLEEVFEALAEAEPARLREELVQVAALCIKQIEAIDRQAVLHLREVDQENRFGSPPNSGVGSEESRG